MSTTTAPTTSTLAGFMGQRSWIGHADEAQTFDGPVPREAAIELLSFPMVEASISVTALTPDGVVSFDAPDRKAIIRLDTQDVFGIFKSGYKIHLYPEWLVENTEIISDGGLEIGTVALTKRGARALLQAEMPETRVATAPGAEPVAHRPHLTAATSADGSIASTYGVGTRVLICENELAVGFGGGFHAFAKSFSGMHRVRHTSGSLDRVGQVRTDLGLVVEEVGDTFDKEFRELVSQHVSDSRWREFVNAYTGVEKAKEGRSKTIAQGKADALNTLWRSDERVAPWANSAYGVLAAINTASHHVFGADKGRTQRNQDRTIDGKWEEQARNTLQLLASA